jgi:hypothetical protein
VTTDASNGSGEDPLGLEGHWRRQLPTQVVLGLLHGDSITDLVGHGHDHDRQHDDGLSAQMESLLTLDEAEGTMHNLVLENTMETVATCSNRAWGARRSQRAYCCRTGTRTQWAT